MTKSLLKTLFIYIVIYITALSTAMSGSYSPGASYGSQGCSSYGEVVYDPLESVYVLSDDESDSGLSSCESDKFYGLLGQDHIARIAQRHPNLKSLSGELGDVTTLGGSLRGLPLESLELTGSGLTTLGYLPKTIVSLSMSIPANSLSTGFSSVIYLPKLQHLKIFTSFDRFETFAASLRDAIADPFAPVKTKIVVIDQLIDIIPEATTTLSFITELRAAKREIEESGSLEMDTSPIERLMQSPDLITAMREILSSGLPTMRPQLFSYDIQEQLSAIRTILAGFDTESPVIRSMNRILHPAIEAVIAAMPLVIPAERRRELVINEQGSILLRAMAEQATRMSLELEGID